MLKALKRTLRKYFCTLKNRLLVNLFCIGPRNKPFWQAQIKKAVKHSRNSRTQEKKILLLSSFPDKECWSNNANSASLNLSYR